MSRSSTDVTSGISVYVLIEIENGKVYSRVFGELSKAVAKASSWVDSYYKYSEKEVPKKLPGTGEVALKIGPTSKSRSFQYHSCPGFELIIRRCRLI